MEDWEKPKPSQTKLTEVVKTIKCAYCNGEAVIDYRLSDMDTLVFVCRKCKSKNYV